MEVIKWYDGEVQLFDYDEPYAVVPWDERIILIEITGLKDKHGKEIFEGNILGYHSKTKESSPVYFEDGCFKVQQKSTRCIRTADYHLRKYECEVVGNIYENPELLNN